MNLRSQLLRRTLAIGATTSILLAIALAAWTVHNTRVEIAATRALVGETVRQVLSAQAGGPAGADAANPPVTPRLRHVQVSRVDGAQAGAPARDDWVSRLFGIRNETISLGDAPDGSQPVLVIGGDIRAELSESAPVAASIFVGLALFLAAVIALQYRTLVRAFAPIDEIAAGLRAFEHGEFDARLKVPPTEELGTIARSFNALADTLQRRIREQQAMAQSLITLRADERKALARELHDDLGQAVTACAVNLHMVRAAAGSQPELLASVEQVQRELAVLQNGLRHVLGSLRDDPATLDPVRSLETLMESWRERDERVRWQVADTELERLKSLRLPEYNVAYRVLQESLTNLFRHARPTEVRIAVSTDDAVRLVVENDGVPPTAAERPGHGLLGMHERAAAVGGRIRAGRIAPDRWRVELVLGSPPAAMAA